MKEKSSKKRKGAESLEGRTEPATANVISHEGSGPKKRKISVTEIEVDINAPEPPSKRALRQLRKAKLVPGTSQKPLPVVPAKLQAQKRSEHGIWIGNLPWSCTKNDLRAFLVANAEIADEEITRIHLPKPDDNPGSRANDAQPGKKQCNKGFAYVDLATPEDVAKVIKISEKLLSGRRVLIKDSKSFEGRPRPSKGGIRKWPQAAHQTRIPGGSTG